MGENSHIQWCDHTFNPWRGCTKVSPGCLHCYAEALSKRTGRGEYKRGVPRERTGAENWKKPVKWNRGIGCGDCDPCIAGQRCPLVYHPRVFCASLSDWLDDEVPIEWLADLLALIHDTSNLDWLLLTKRPENWRERLMAVIRFWEEIDRAGGEQHTLSKHYALVLNWACGDAPANVWIGTTVEDQTRAEERIPHLLQIPARVRFLSAEPLLGAVDLSSALDPWNYCSYCGGSFYFNPNCPDRCPSCAQPGCMSAGYGSAVREEYDRRDGRMEAEDGAPIHWLICGGESGGKARPMEIEWARSLKDQCAAAGTAFFMKQLGGVRDARGELAQMPEDLRVRQFPKMEVLA